MKEILTREHKLFDEFYNELGSLCDFKESDDGEIVWKCGGDFAKTRSILLKFENVDIDGTLRYMEENGGYCDCEIIFNVEPKGEAK